MAIFVVNNLAFDFDLPLMLLYYCINRTNPETDPVYIFLLLATKPDEIISVLNLLKHVNNGTNLENDFCINPKDINKSNLCVELQEKIKEEKPLDTSDKIKIIIEFIQNRVSIFIPSSYKYIMYGFNEIVNVGVKLKDKKISPYELKKLLCITKIDLEYFINNQIKFFENFPENKKEMFLQVIRDLSKATYDIEIQIYNNKKLASLDTKTKKTNSFLSDTDMTELDILVIKEDKEKLFEEKKLKFFKQLINFWGATNTPVKGEKNYKIAEGIEPGMFKSHTCFYTLDMPANIESPEDLRNKLITSITEVEQGVLGLYGGKSKGVAS
jgi:hypothetical protein